MNSRFLVLILAAFGLLAKASAAQPADYTPMKVIQTYDPAFPRQLAELGIKEGQVNVSIQVDHEGKLSDHLVTFYTHRAFADSAVFAVKRWRYEPAWVNGEPRSATIDLKFTYESRGLVVVSLDPSVYVARRSMELMPGAYGYRVATLRELDRIPTPKKVVSPPYPVEASRTPRAASVAVSFYIDEEGRVRLPAVNRLATQGNEVFAAAAITAVTQWEFEPPTSNGRPVLVEVSQTFNFTQAAVAAKSE